MNLAVGTGQKVFRILGKPVMATLGTEVIGLTPMRMTGFPGTDPNVHSAHRVCRNRLIVHVFRRLSWRAMLTTHREVLLWISRL
jgi:hypothetical protein